MRWAVGITTAPREPSTLVECVCSVRAAGFEPIVYAEPGTDLTGVDCPIVQRETKLGAWHNWVSMCRDLMEKNPDAEFVLSIQDDTKLAPRCREFLDQQSVPEDAGFISLYTPSHYQTRWHVYDKSGQLVADLPDEKRAKLRLVRHRGGRVIQAPKPPGIFHQPTQSLWGACALAFPRAVLEKILDHKIARNWKGANGRQRGDVVRNVDTAIGKVINALRLKMYFYTPSLSQHFAPVSSLKGHGGCTGKRAAAFVAVDPFKDCVPAACTPVAGSTAVSGNLAADGFWFVNNNDLDHVIADMCSRLPSDISAVAAIPRSGFMAAYLVAKHLHIPMVPIETLLGQKVASYRPSVSRPLRAANGRVLVIDDSVNSGKTWNEVGPRLKAPHYKAAAFVTPLGATRVDYWGAMLGNPHCFHWQWLSSCFARKFLLDMDGVICEDWKGDWSGVDKDRYERFLAEARPLHLPRVPVLGIVTGREESRRAETERWLARHGVQYGSLIMNPGGKKHAEFKAEVYKATPKALAFVESSEKQAREIHGRTKRPVLSCETWVLHGGGQVLLPERIGLPVTA